MPAARTLLKLLAVLLAAYVLFVLAGLAGCDTSGSGSGDILRRETVP